MVKKIAQAANTLGRRLWGHQQRRFAGDLPVKPNKFVEEAGYRRENIEREFKWDGTTLTRIAVFGFIVPYGIYTLAYVVVLLPGRFFLDTVSLN